MRWATRTNQFLLDFFVLSLAYCASFLFRFEGNLDERYTIALLITWPYTLLLKFIVFYAFSIFKISWRFIALRDIQKIVAASGAACCFLVLSRLLFGNICAGWEYAHYITIPYGVIFIDFFLSITGFCSIRALRRLHAERLNRNQHDSANKVMKRTLLIGAGESGVQVAREILARPDMGIKASGFIDDDLRKVDTVISGIKVLGQVADLATICQQYNIEQLLITISNISGSDLRRIKQECNNTKLPTKIIPSLRELMDGTLSITKMRDVSIEDLLGRNAVSLDMELIKPMIFGKNILVSGAGGSIGSELCRQIAKFSPQKLILVEQAENPLFAINNELLAQNAVTIPIIADITDRPRVEQIFTTYKPDIIFHAAAHKHVPLMEGNPQEAIKNNVIGTRIMAETADKFHSAAFLMISTDKAVNPSSIMGASKRVAELIVQNLSKTSQTKFVAVRFGNVLGSSGSVIPTFLQQIKNGGPVTVTHPEMKRYFMTIPEACQLVLEATALGEGGEIFILDMGEPIKIVDLARDLITLSGYRPDDEIKIVFSGIRPGEKLFEELSVAAEKADKTKHPKIFVGHITSADNNSFKENLKNLENAALNNQNIIPFLKPLVPEYNPENG